MHTLSLQRWALTLSLLLLGLAATIALGAFYGAVPLDWHQAWSVPGSRDHNILFLSRLPRVLLATVVGMALSSAGASFQGLLRNPLADPFILGVSAGAALCSVVALACGLGFPWISFVGSGGSLVSMAIVYGIATYKRRPNPQTLLLAGVIFNALAHAFILFINALSPVEQSHRIFMLLVGSLDPVSYTDLLVVASLMGIGLLILLWEARPLNLISESPETAASLGIDPGRHQKRIFFAASLMVGAVVSLSGLIGFVGLFVPHIARRLWGPDHRLLIPASALLGGALLVGCDLLARTVGFYTGLDSVLPVGAVTALIGAPFFLILLRRLH